MSRVHQSPLRVAVIGAGIIGLLLAIALEKRGISYVVYEQAASIPATGAGLNCNPAGIRALKYISPDAYAAFKEVFSGHHRHDKQLYFTYTDGQQIVKVTSNEEFGSVHRVRFVDAILKRVHLDKVRFGKRINSIESNASSNRMNLLFEDGSIETSDVVLGCDGVKSRVRSLVVGDAHPSAKASFSHYVVYRGLVNRNEAEQVLEPVLTEGAALHVCNGAYFVSYPASEDLINFGLFLPHAAPWPHFPSVSHHADKKELLKKLEAGHPNALKVAQLLPDQLDVWAVYDTLDNPLPAYNHDCMAVLGDAAHASSPNLGAGAGMGYEDIAVIAALLSDINESPHSWKGSDQSSGIISSTANGDVNRHQQPDEAKLRHQISAALTAYNITRKTRTQWLVKASRYLGDCYAMQTYNVSTNMEKFEKDVLDSYDQIWRENILDIVSSARCQRDRLMIDT